MNSKLDTRLLSVDLLRAIAAIGVFLFHASLFAGFDKFSLPISIPLISFVGNIPNFFSLGASGVSLFFLVSGYCLTRSWYRKPVQEFQYSEYYFRRSVRIYPAYIFSLLVTLGVWLLIKWNASYFLNTNFDGVALFWDFLIHAFFLQGFLPISFQSFNGTLWSMSTEVQFYLVLPFLYFLMIRNTPLFVVVIVCIFCLAIRAFASSNVALAGAIDGGVSYSVLISSSLLGRLFEFVIGIFIASLEYQKKFPKVGWFTSFLLLGTAALIRWKGPGWLADPFFGFGYGVLLICLLTNIEDKKILFVKKFKILRNVQIFGVYSYSFFLIHWPILLISDKLLWTSEQSGWIRLVVEAPICFLLSYLISKWMFLNIEEKGQLMLLNYRSVATAAS